MRRTDASNTYTWIHGRRLFTSRHGREVQGARSHSGGTDYMQTRAARRRRQWLPATRREDRNGRHEWHFADGVHRGDARPRHSRSRRDAERVHARSSADTRPPSVAMAKRPGSRARSDTQPPDLPRRVARSHEIGVNKPDTRLSRTVASLERTYTLQFDRPAN